MEITTMRGVADLPALYCPEGLSEAEMLECEGGKLSGALWFSIVSIIVSNWQDIREGFADGASGKSPRY